MAEPKPFGPVKLVCGILAAEERVFDLAQERLEELFGPIDARSGRPAFDLTDYYEPEMGPGLRRMFAAFERLVEPEGLSAVKLRTNALEAAIRDEVGGSGRPVNLDPGFVTRAALIMATAKDFSHRIPLRDGIYAHLELLFGTRDLRFLPWTYPDFRDGRYTAFLLETRRILAGQTGRDVSGEGKG
jgi:hypothetical protein